MEFHTFGNKANKTLLIMHGMLCDWRKFYKKLEDLADNFFLIFPAMNGCYDGAPNFVSFSEECQEIEDYITENFDGKIYAVYGISQGATLMTELLARNNILIEKAILDGVYVAHQGKLCAYFGLKTILRMKRNSGKPSKALVSVLPLMGLDESDMGELSMMYWGSSPASMKANLYENYTYHANPCIADSKTKVYLWCGSKEPYARKSHRILKKYLKIYKEYIFENYGHGQLMYKDTGIFIQELKKVLN